MDVLATLVQAVHLIKFLLEKQVLSKCTSAPVSFCEARRSCGGVDLRVWFLFPFAKQEVENLVATVPNTDALFAEEFNQDIINQHFSWYITTKGHLQLAHA